MKQHSHYDAIIIGGGMVGLALACAISPTLRVALVDATPLAEKDDHRLIALNYSSYCLLKNLGLWNALSKNATPIQTVHVSQQGHFGVTRLHHTECHLPVLGYVIPAKYIEMALNEAARQISNLNLMRPATLKTLSIDTANVTAVIQTRGAETTLTANVLIGADGTHSTVRRLANIPTEKTDYQQTAIVTVTELQRPHHHTAYERFLASGAIAMLPLSGNFAATIWTADNHEINRLMKLNDNEFLSRLQKQFGYRLGRFLSGSQRYTYPLQLQTAIQHFSDNVILIGNAAHTLHPVAAQGLNLALTEIAMLAQVISENPSAPPWKNYLAWQQKQFTNSLHLSHHLLQLFAQDFAPAGWARSAAMLALDICPPLKRRFALKALGRAQSLPALLVDQGLE